MGAPSTMSCDFDPVAMIQPPSHAAESPPSSLLFRKMSMYLPEGYTPGPFDVICQRGKDCNEHIGNRRFRACVDRYVEAYLNSKSRQEKSVVISDIVKTVSENEKNQFGGFIMKDAKTQRWHHVDSKVARDKVGNALRDAIKQREDGVASCDLFGDGYGSNNQESSRNSGKAWMDQVDSTAANLNSRKNIEQKSYFQAHSALSTNDSVTSSGMNSTSILHGHLGRMKQESLSSCSLHKLVLPMKNGPQPLGANSLQELMCHTSTTYGRTNAIYGNTFQASIDQACFSIGSSSGAFAQMGRALEGVTSTKAPDCCTLTNGGVEDVDFERSTRHLIEAFADSMMEIEHFDDFEPRPIESMFRNA